MSLLRWLGCFFLVVMVIAVAGRLIDGEENDGGSSEEDAPATVIACDPEAGTARVRVTNPADFDASFIVTVALESSDHDTQYDTTVTSAMELRPGQSKEESVRFLAEERPTSAVCSIRDVLPYR